MGLRKTIFGRSKVSTIYYRGKNRTNLSTQMYSSFNPTGTRLYLTLHNGPDSVAQYSLSTPWDISTAVFLNRSLTINQNGESQPRGHYISPDGTRLFVSGTSSGSVLSYLLSTPWDVSTASYLGFKSFGIYTNTIAFTPDGMSFFNHTGSSLIKYLLTTPWDLNTAVSSQSINFSANSFVFTPDGKTIFHPKLVGERSVMKISLKAPYELAGANTSASINLSTVIPAANFYAVNFSIDGLKMFWSSYTSSIYEFDLSKPYDINGKLIIV